MPNQHNSSESESELSQAIATSIKEQDDETRAVASPLIAQVIGVADTIRALRADLDDLETEFARRIAAIRKRMGVKL